MFQTVSVLPHDVLGGLGRPLVHLLEEVLHLPLDRSLLIAEELLSLSADGVLELSSGLLLILLLTFSWLYLLFFLVCYLLTVCQGGHLGFRASYLLLS
jgi:hypothetical protein